MGGIYDYLRVGSLVRSTGPKLWRNPNQVLRVAKRKNTGGVMWPVYIYFVVALGDPVGHGAWLLLKELRQLSPLELLAVQVFDSSV